MMFGNIEYGFPRHPILSQLRVRCKFYTVSVKSVEIILIFINRVQQVGLILKSMNVEIDRKVLPMAILNSPTTDFKIYITKIDAG